MAEGNYHRGRRVEYRTVEALEARGFFAQRAASSKGRFDVFAFDPERWYVVSAKRAGDLAGARRAYNAEKKKLLALAGTLPPGTTQALWIWADRLPDKPRGGWYCQEELAAEEAP